jgi:hypothetical protein
MFVDMQDYNTQQKCLKIPVYRVECGRWVDLALEGGNCHVSEDINPLFTAKTDDEI